MKVSVVTATHKRHDLLIRTMKSLEAQTFTDWEHIIVADGRDADLQNVVRAHAGPAYNYRLGELGRNWHTATGKVNYGGAPRLMGTYLAAGDYIAYLDDDNEFFPNHLTDLVFKIEEGYDFVYGMAEIVRQDKSFERHLGDGQLEFGNIDTSMVMHRWDLVIKENWNPRFGFGDDWDVFDRWIKGGAKVGFVPKVTLRYYRKY